VARRKPKVAGLAITDLLEADSALAALAALDREISRIEIEMNEGIQAVREAGDEAAAPYRQKREQIEAALATYATVGKETLFTKGKRSLKLIHGIIGFRASEEVKTLPKIKWADVLLNLKAMAKRCAGVSHCIRIKEEPDKEALRQMPKSLQAEAGVRIVAKDTFYYEVKSETVAEKAA